MEDADRTYAMGLAALRQAAELTQVELARRMGVTQAAVSRMEQPHDLLLSTLNAYLEAVGGHATVIVRFADGARSPTGPLPAHRVRRAHRRGRDGLWSEGVGQAGWEGQVDGRRPRLRRLHAGRRGVTQPAPRRSLRFRYLELSWSQYRCSYMSAQVKIFPRTVSVAVRVYRCNLRSGVSGEQRCGSTAAGAA